MHSIPFVYYSAVAKISAWINHEGHNAILESSSYSQGCYCIIYNNALILSEKASIFLSVINPCPFFLEWTSTPSVSSPIKTEMI